MNVELVIKIQTEQRGGNEEREKGRKIRAQGRGQ